MLQSKGVGSRVASPGRLCCITCWGSGAPHLTVSCQLQMLSVSAEWMHGAAVGCDAQLMHGVALLGCAGLAPHCRWLCCGQHCVGGAASSLTTAYKCTDGSMWSVLMRLCTLGASRCALLW